MTKSFVARLRVKPDRRDDFEVLQTELKRLVHEREPDAFVYELLRSEAEPDEFLVVATFRDAAAFDLHMTIDFHDRLVPPILECVAGKMELRFYTSLGWEEGGPATRVASTSAPGAAS